MASFEKIIVSISYKLKPILFKVLPKDMLRKAKKKMIENSYNKLESMKILPFEREEYKDGINLIGSIRAETGLGQSCRLVANEISHSKYPFSIFNYNQIGMIRTADTSWENKISEGLPYNINVIHINPYELMLAYQCVDKSIWDRRYNIGFWLWELEEFPSEWIRCIQHLDEIWTPSEFISNSIRKVTDKPVKTVPYCVEAPVKENCGRAEFGLPEDKFLFLMMYDSNSIMERKNPMGVLNAYKKAFAKDNQDVGIVIKINSPAKGDIEKLKEILKGYENLYFITEVLEKEMVNSLVQSVDVVVSLHRAEGFGLVLAEAMILGTPTIATNWSSNTEFMNDKVSCLVDYELISIEEDMGPFKKGQRWADANTDTAAIFMKKLYEEKGFYDTIAAQAQAYIQEKLSIERATTFINERVEEIYKSGSNRKLENNQPAELDKKQQNINQSVSDGKQGNL